MVYLLLTTLLHVMVVAAKVLTPQDLISLPRPGTALGSPNGRLAIYAQTKYDLTEDKTTSGLYLVDLVASTVTNVTEPSFDTLHRSPFFLDDDNVAFFQHNNDDPVDQLYVLNIKKQGEKAYQLTNFPLAFDNVKYNIKSGTLAFSALVYEDEGTLEGTRKRDNDLQKHKRDSALVFDQLMVRHWDTFVPEKKNHIFVVHVEKSAGQYRLIDEPLNLLRNTGLQSPDFPMGDSSDYDISPDGTTIAFAVKITGRENAWQTSKHIYTVSTSGEGTPVSLNGDIQAASSNPVFSPTGLLAYLQMYTPQYESDRNRIVIVDPISGSQSLVAQDWDRSPSELVFSNDGSLLYAVAGEYGREKIFAIDLSTGDVTTVTEEHAVSGLSVLPDDTLLFTASSLQHPNFVYTLKSQGQPVQHGPEADLAKHLEQLNLSATEEFEFQGALGDRVHGWLLKPADFDSEKKYPIAFLIHGGPQSAWTDSWSTRWNPQVFTGAGFVAVAINPHGSTGYGQKFTDAIHRNWGSYPYYDLEKGLEHVLSTYGFLDGERVAGLGASYGGYMINWINGHSKRFKVLVNHDGMFSTINSYYTTDEVYFPEREFGGAPFDPLARITYERWSPSNYVRHWKTPTLVIHGGHDYRLVDGEAFSTFTALQRQGVPSRLVYFPNENHWTLKPANSLRWHKEVLDWIKFWTATEGAAVEDTTKKDGQVDYLTDATQRVVHAHPEK